MQLQTVQTLILELSEPFVISSSLTYVVNVFHIIATMQATDPYINVVFLPNVSEKGKLNIDPTISPAKNNIIKRSGNVGSASPNSLMNFSSISMSPRMNDKL